MKNTRLTKRSKVTWGDPLNWSAEPRKILHPFGCRCQECQRSIAWAQGYQKHIAKVDR